MDSSTSAEVAIAIADYIRWRNKMDVAMGIVVGLMGITAGLLIGSVWLR